MLEFRDDDGKRRSQSLHHADRERGKLAAEELATALRKSDGPRSGELTVNELFDKYVREGPQKTAAKARHDRTARGLFESCWGPAVHVVDLDRRDWDRFITERRAGRLRPVGRKTETGVRDRMIGYDLKFLMAVCNWAETVRVNGRPLLERNPFRKFAVPVESSPRQPITTQEEYAALYEAAKALGPQVELFLYLVHETGHRSLSVSRLRWVDVDLIGRRVVWAKEHDKMKAEHVTPLLDEHVEALRRVRREMKTIGDAWVFPSPEGSGEPISRRQVVRWWAQLEAAAGLVRVKGRGWHSLRRKFASDNDELPASQLMALGGWRSYKTIVEIYQKPREDALRSALARRGEARKAVVARTTTTNGDQLSESHSERLPEVVAAG
jgi:integrase